MVENVTSTRPLAKAVELMANNEAKKATMLRANYLLALSDAIDNMTGASRPSVSNLQDVRDMRHDMRNRPV